jgi:hypothetical protein
MSVILFDKADVFQEMANAYEGLKPHMQLSAYISFTAADDKEFYGALRRLYFANVATFMCQYHDETPEHPAIDPFTDLQGKADIDATFEHKIYMFISGWRSLKYNLVTNGGEEFRPVQSYKYIERLAARYMEALVDMYGERE